MALRHYFSRLLRLGVPPSFCPPGPGPLLPWSPGSPQVSPSQLIHPSASAPRLEGTLTISSFHFVRATQLFPSLSPDPALHLPRPETLKLLLAKDGRFRQRGREEYARMEINTREDFLQT